MRLTITIDMDNAAFEADAASEVRNVLAGVQWAISGMDGPLGGRLHLDRPGTCQLRDSNGNTVGAAEVAEGGGVSVLVDRADVSELFHIINKRGECALQVKLLDALRQLDPRTATEVQP